MGKKTVIVVISYLFPCVIVNRVVKKSSKKRNNSSIKDDLFCRLHIIIISFCQLTHVLQCNYIKSLKKINLFFRDGNE